MKSLFTTVLSGSIAMLLGGASLAIELSPEEALHQAAASGNFKAIKVQLEAAADINAKNEAGDTALHVVATHSGYVECAIAMLKEGADPNLTNKRGQTPLFRATFNAMVLRYGYSAMYQNRPKFEELLHLDLGADLEKPRPNLKPKDWNAEMRKTLGPGEADLNAMTMLKALLDAGAKPDFKDPQGFTPLDLAKAHGNYERLAKIMGLEAKYLAGMEGAQSVMHGGATYWVTIHGGHRSDEPLKLLEKAGK